MTAKYKCGNEVRVNDLGQCVQDPHSSMFPGHSSQFYRVVWVRGGSEGSARDITLDGLEKKDCSPDADRFIETKMLQPLRDKLAQIKEIAK